MLGEGDGPAQAAVKVRVRSATREDMPLIHTMIRELAEYEGYPEGPELSVDDFIRDGFDSSPPWFFALVAECGAEVVGYALCSRAYSSWTRRALYVEDIYVRPTARRRRVATRLLARVAQMAVSEDAGRIDWHVLEDNAPAQALYAAIGARDLRRTEGRAALRLDRPQIDALAAQDIP